MNLFTVEQLELIRRLRLTGITPEAVLERYHRELYRTGQKIITRCIYRECSVLNPKSPSIYSITTINVFKYRVVQIQYHQHL
ncbi:unnamed protein product [Brugia timori]|uniref:HNF-p1 domain-containing protein n=1 Tax=Brugia timori TaxID=42155 RepID=A0A0R3QQK8_9BILA|nr:unnamed protein product [Brugia timori]